MNIDLTGISDHVDNVFVKHNELFHKVFYVDTYFSLILCISFIIVCIIFIIKHCLYIDRKKLTIIIISMLGIIFGVYYGTNTLSHIHTVAKRTSDVTSYSINKNTEYNTKINPGELNLNKITSNNNQETIEFNKAINKKYGLKSLNDNYLPISTNIETINSQVVNHGISYMQNNKLVSCAFNYDVIKKNNVGQIKTIKMNMIVCSNNGSTQIIKSK